MQSRDAIKVIKARSGKSGVQISEELGKSRSWLGQTISRGSDPQAGTLAAIAAVCGYSLALIGRDGDRIDIDAPER